MASAAVQSEWMSGPCPPMTTSCLPTALILHRGPLIWLLLILFLSFFPSFSSSLHLSLSLSLRSLCPGQKDQTGGDGRLPQQPTTWRAKRRKRRPQPRTGWVSSFFFWYVHMWVCECYVNHDPHNTVEHICDAKSIQLEQLCLWTRLIKTRMWHHLCSLYVSFERQLVEKQTTAARSWDEMQKRISGWGNPNKYINTSI